MLKIITSESIEQTYINNYEKEYLKIHSKQLLLSIRKVEKNIDIIKIQLSQAKRVLNLINDYGSIILLTKPQDLWIGKTFTRRSSIFNVSTYIARELNDRVLILNLDQHLGIGFLDLMLDAEKILYIDIYSASEDSKKLYKMSINNPWKILNIPLPPGITDKLYLQVLEQLVIRDVVQAFNPKYLVVPLGFDTHRDDPKGEFQLTCDFFHSLGIVLKELNEKINLRSIVVTECCHSRKVLNKCFPNLVAGLLGIDKMYHENEGVPSSLVKEFYLQYFRKVKYIVNKYWFEK
ncbi:MAG: hypothetical protein B6V02_00930 [Thermoprotei archaeon ex4572_64]|nr:MAG: hypothetical protein B6V02_00930 [Thermoprotei archaeon ex4572_64]